VAFRHRRNASPLIELHIRSTRAARATEPRTWLDRRPRGYGREGFRWSRSGRVLRKNLAVAFFSTKMARSLVRNHTLDRGIVDAITQSFPLIKIEPCGPQGESEACRCHVPYCSAPAPTGSNILSDITPRAGYCDRWQVASRAEHFFGLSDSATHGDCMVR
jgi:hypothetical protein